MSRDPMSAALAWLNAFRTHDVEAALEMIADDAVIECDATNRLRSFLAGHSEVSDDSEIWDIEPSSAGVSLSYRARSGRVHADLKFDLHGRIVYLGGRFPE